MPTKCKDPLASVYVELARLNEAMRSHAAQIPHLELVRVRLEVMLSELNELTHHQSSLEAARQETTRRIQELTDQLCKVGNFLKVGLKEHFGTTNEILVAFGMRPFRRRRRAKPEQEAIEAAEEEAEPAEVLTNPVEEKLRG